MVYFIITPVLISQQANIRRPLKTFGIVLLQDLWYRPIESEDYKNSKLIYDIYSLKKFTKLWLYVYLAESAKYELF